MYKIDNKSNEYYIFDLIRNQYVNQIFTFQELLEYIAQYNNNFQFLRTKYNNDFLDNFNATLQDKMPDSYIEQNGYKFTRINGGLRKYVVIDGNCRIIDVREFHEEIREIQSKQREPWCYYIYRMRKYVGENYQGVEFRKEPIPFINNKKSNIYRSIKVMNEKRQGCDKETQKYIRPKRRPKNLPSSFDVMKRPDNCWKSQKKRKQWM